MWAEVSRLRLQLRHSQDTPTRSRESKLLVYRYGMVSSHSGHDQLRFLGRLNEYSVQCIAYGLCGFTFLGIWCKALGHQSFVLMVS